MLCRRVDTDQSTALADTIGTMTTTILVVIVLSTLVRGTADTSLCRVNT